ncbi:MAG: ribonuclease HII [Clostridia bacterium]|nr:ribonuclease HII [Clostridia bacterium]MBR5388227.1 ribonuclease HII [Clostridia bacterium]
MDDLFYERKYRDKGCKNICGVDEVGRGPLAGPVVCCAVIMPEDGKIAGVRDSKKLSAKRREALSKEIREKAVALSIKEISPEEIDEINILQAVRKCMTQAVNALSVTPDITIVDGQDTGLSFPAEYVIGGDDKSYTVACASIVAKVYRDNLMVKYAEEFPEYGFEKHKGYGTKEHIEKIKEIGPCRLHRRTFIKNFWGK